MEMSHRALDQAFRALGDSTRRTIMRFLAANPGATTAEIGALFPHISRWAVMKHLTVLRDAGLVQSLPRGRHRCHYRVDRSLDGLRDWLAGSDAGVDPSVKEREAHR